MSVMRRRLFSRSKDDPRDTRLLMHFDDSVVDVSLYNNTVESESYVSYDTGKFSKAARVSSVSGKIKLLSSDVKANLDIFNWEEATIEWWERRSSVSQMGGAAIELVSSSSYKGSRILAGHYISDTDDFVVALNHTGVYLSLGSMPGTSWVHYALTKKGSLWTTYRNGTRRATETYSDKVTLNYCTILNREGFNQGIKTRYIDELRISSVCRYNGSFVPKTSPFTI